MNPVTNLKHYTIRPIEGESSIKMVIITLRYEIVIRLSQTQYVYFFFIVFLIFIHV